MYIIHIYAFGIDINAWIKAHQLTLEEIEALEYVDINVEIPELHGFYRNDQPHGIELMNEYHGGCGSEYFPGGLGIAISSDNNNPDYHKDIKNANGKKFAKIWKKYSNLVLESIQEQIEEAENYDYYPELMKILYLLRSDVKHLEPDFFTFECSS